MTWWARFACLRLGWHPQRYCSVTSFDGVTMQAKCRRCGVTGLIDSQGNLF